MPRKHRRVLGYARVSSHEQARGSSLIDQQNAIRAYAEARGMTVAQFYVEAESAVREKIEHRAQIRALMADVREGDLVVCDKLDRWSRDAEFSYASIRQILERGASFYAVGDQCDPSTPEGDSMMSFRILFAREEHKRIKLRMVGTRKLLRDQGYFVEGLPPRGYRRSAPKGSRGVGKNVLVIVDDEAEQVRRMFRLCVSGKSLQQIADALELPKDHVHDVLANRLYTGRIRNTAGEWIAGKHEAIVDADLFERAERARRDRMHGGARYRAGAVETADWILRDVARCAICEGKMAAAYAGDREARRYYYRCRNACTRRYVPVRSTEQAIDELVFARLAAMRGEIARGPEELPVVDTDFAAELAAIDRRRKRVVDMYEDSAITREEMRKRLARLDESRLRVEAARDEAARMPALADAETRRALLGDLHVVERVWRRASRGEKRVAVELLASQVRLEAGKPPAPVWRSASELAEQVTPVNTAEARTCSRRRDVDSRFAAVFTALGLQ